SRSGAAIVAAHAFSGAKWRSRGPPVRKCPRLCSRNWPSSKLIAEFAPSSFSSTTTWHPRISANGTLDRSSSPGCSREDSRCGVRGYLRSTRSVVPGGPGPPTADFSLDRPEQPPLLGVVGEVAGGVGSDVDVPGAVDGDLRQLVERQADVGRGEDLVLLVEQRGLPAEIHRAGRLIQQLVGARVAP